MAGIALAEGVESANVVGYQDITVKPGFNCISLNFDAVGGGGISIQDLISTNDLIAGNAAATSDRIQIWDGTAFTDYYYRAYKATNPGRFLLGPCWVAVNNASVKADLTLHAGEGFWFARPSDKEAGALVQESPIAVDP